MKRNIVNRALYGMLLMGGLLMGGCHEDGLESNPVLEEGTTRFTLKPDFAREVEVKSVSRPDSYENTITDVWVIQFDGDGNVLTGTLNTTTGSGYLTEYFPSTEIEESSITLRLHADVKEIWFIANTGNSSLYSSVTNKAGVEGVQPKNVENETSLAPENNGIIMRGVWKDGDASYNINDISMKRAIAKVDFTLKVGDELTTKGDAFALQSVQVMNVPKVLHYFRNPTTLNTTPYPTLTAGGVLNYPVEEAAENDLWTDAGLQWMPTGDAAIKGEIITTTGKSYWWYLPENARGKGTAKDQRDKCKATAPAGEGDYCTFIRVKGYYKSGELVSEVTYDIYLGENNTDDYNLMQNTNYKVTTTILGVDRADTRISKETGEEFTPVNYLDYTDNSSPWIVFARESEGAYAWSGLVAPLEKIAPWKLPTKKEMMLAWIYIAPISNVFGTTPCWVEEATETGRWFVGMGIGEVLPPGSQATGSEAGASNTLWAVRDVSTGFRYPYVEGGKEGSNIIVSRDANGGVKEEALRLYGVEAPVAGGDETSASNRVAAKFEVAPPATEETYQSRVTWDQAKAYCEGLDGNWRMPTQRELMLIYVMNDQLEHPLYTRPNGTPETEQEDNGEHIFYWSGTSDKSEDGDQAWSVCFCEHDTDNLLSGKVEGYPKNYVNYVRCVRDVE